MSITEIVRVTELRVGDLVDLASCPYLQDHGIAKYEYATVTFLEQETDGCIVVGYEGIDSVGYRPNDVLLRVC